MVHGELVVYFEYTIPFEYWGCLWLGCLIEFEIANNICVARGGIEPGISHMISVV